MYKLVISDVFVLIGTNEVNGNSNQKLILQNHVTWLIYHVLMCTSAR